MATIMDKAPRRDSPRQTLASWLDGGEKRIGHDLLTYVERYLEFFKKKKKKSRTCSPSFFSLFFFFLFSGDRRDQPNSHDPPTPSCYVADNDRHGRRRRVRSSDKMRVGSVLGDDARRRFGAKDVIEHDWLLPRSPCMLSPCSWQESPTMPRALRRLVHLVLFCPLSKGLQVSCPPPSHVTLHGCEVKKKQKNAPVFELVVAQQGRRQVRPVRARGTVCIASCRQR